MGRPRRRGAVGWHAHPTVLRRGADGLLPCAGDALGRRRVRREQALAARRLQLGEVRGDEALQRAGEGVGVGQPRGVRVGGALAAARVPCRDQADRDAGQAQRRARRPAATRDRPRRRARARPAAPPAAPRRRRSSRRSRRPPGRGRAGGRDGRDGRARGPSTAPVSSRPSSVSPSRMRRVGPKPTTAALEAVVFSDRRSSRTSRTRRRERTTRSSATSRSGPAGSGSERRNSGSSTTGATNESSVPTASAAAQATTGQPSGHSRCAQIRSSAAGSAKRGAEREALGAVGEPAAQRLAREAGRDGGAPAGDGERQGRQLQRRAGDEGDDGGALGEPAGDERDAEQRPPPGRRARPAGAVALRAGRHGRRPVAGPVRSRSMRY